MPIGRSTAVSTPTETFMFSRNISNMRKSVLSDILTPRRGLKERGTAELFLSDFVVFGYLMKHTFKCLINFSDY